ncbi:MAG: ATP-binding SpoIIE family protein phosphatase [Nostoc sp. ZfuVER08]|jgi:anti-sigma regulatory factor (Ser/Thr protein kinase)|uniref:SpoIIE family protein phosphatase n=1 Tax=Nostoc punctiforme FACHB-252 TaxID=1357509 RepID=A0ABR8HCC5_NOSPU|nr:ATP-binding SpoIIE family protein phosphatase [Nostoc punctiforme]MBD2612748.1 SpoIIE family protein phosphatase [Nostoc punctiforme FACHB-252]MBL1198269.1 SpoIIE family protein phosphatase [Nostoc sp. GBBB01]MDZ8011028.1 ATP-binding protein/SpoIIE family protein phosphatase [Nostoc sp. ZfuVER08]
MRQSVAIAISESSQTGEARRVAMALVTRLGFQETQRGKVAIVVTEVAKNLVQHARGGVMLLRSLKQDLTVGIEVLSLDKGPGMVDIDECLQDGFSTAGTSGNGLGAIRRLSDLLEIYSIPNQGTALLARLWSDPAPHPLQNTLEIGAICLPKRGEEASGDAWASQGDGRHRSVLLVVDGLGHGAAAASAADQAVRVFHDHEDLSPGAMVQAAHAALRSTRGAVLAIAEIDFERESVCFAGIGNISASILSLTQHQNLLSHNGTVGHEIRKIQEFSYPWYANGLLIMHSDGLDSKWRLDRYPGLSQKHPSLIAGLLYRDFNRERDDVTVLVAKGMGI